MPDALLEDVPPPYDGLTRVPDYASVKRSLFTKMIDVKTHQNELRKEEDIYVASRPRRRTPQWPSPSKVLASVFGVCRRAISIRIPSPYFTPASPPPAPAREECSRTSDELERVLADASAKSRMLHLLALLIAVICDSDSSETTFDVVEFRERWETPCVERLRSYQHSGVISPAMSDEIDIFGDFLKKVLGEMPKFEHLDREDVTRICWDAINENDLKKLSLSQGPREMVSLSNLEAPFFGTPLTEEPTCDIKISLTETLVDVKVLEPHRQASTSSTSTSASASSSSSQPRHATTHIRSIMSNVLGEFSALIGEDRLDLDDFRERWYEPSVVQILDAMRDGVLQDDERTRRDASLWLRFLRRSMASLEEEGLREGAPESPGSGKGKLRRNDSSRTSIADQGRRAYFADDYTELR